jgi:TatA/E family protein of Tat protein translocase
MGLDNPLHIAFLVIILLLVFGARRLPEIGRSLGSGMREFKQGISGESTQQQQAPPALPAAQQQSPLTAPQQQQAVSVESSGADPATQQPAPVEPQHHG